MADTDRAELYQRYRPDRVEDIVGQPELVRTIVGYKDVVPNVIMFHGPSGTGKTTAARALANRLGVSRLDYVEISCGQMDKPIEAVRRIDDEMRACPTTGPDGKRMIVLDEVQALTRAKFAQQALLTTLEDAPGCVYFVLCTTDPKAVNVAIHTRCTKIATKALSVDDLSRLVRDVAKKERMTPPPDERLVDRIAAVANGSARAALNVLQKVVGIADPAERLAVVAPPAAERVAFDLVKALLPFKGDPDWKAAAAVLSDLGEADPEGVRRMVVASARTQLLKGGSAAPLCYKAIHCLREPYYDVGTAAALLAADCYRVVHGK